MERCTFAEVPVLGRVDDDAVDPLARETISRHGEEAPRTARARATIHVS